jgi:hypothetical protein
MTSNITFHAYTLAVSYVVVLPSLLPQEYTRLHDKQSCLQGLLSSLGKLAQALASQVVGENESAGRRKRRRAFTHMCSVIQGRASRLPRHKPCSQPPPRVCRRYRRGQGWSMCSLRGGR